MPGTTLINIRNTVRRLIKSESASQITDAQVNGYINDFVLYVMPQRLKQDFLKTTLTFYTTPYIDTYETITDVAFQYDPLYNFKNKYITVKPPIYIAGNPGVLSQSEEEFYGMYPKTQSIVYVDTGDGVTTAFNGTLTNKPILRNNVTVSAYYTDTTGIINEKVALWLKDNGSGALIDRTNTARGSIDYVSGVWTINFANAPDNGSKIAFETVPFVAGIPQSVLFFNTKFIVRPVPDKVYSITMEAYRMPTSLINDTDVPELAEWFNYIAAGAARQILAERRDPEGLQEIEVELKKQEILVNRRTIVQLSNERAATIYSGKITPGSGYNFWNRS